MQAKQEPDWTADDAFWDDAWANMQERLDETPADKRYAAGWWWLGSSALLLLAGLFWLSQTDAASATNSSTPTVPAPATEQPTMPTNNDEVFASLIEVPPADASPVNPAVSPISYPTTTAVKQGRPTPVMAQKTASEVTNLLVSPTLLPPTDPASGAPAPAPENHVMLPVSPVTTPLANAENTRLTDNASDAPAGPEAPVAPRTPYVSEHLTALIIAPLESSGQNDQVALLATSVHRPSG